MRKKNVLILSLLLRSSGIDSLLLADFRLWWGMVLVRNPNTDDLWVIVTAAYMRISIAIIARQESCALGNMDCRIRTLAWFDFI